MTSLHLDFERLADQGWLEIPGYFDVEAATALSDGVRTLAKASLLRPAGIGSEKVVNERVRSDYIHWVENWSKSPATEYYRDEIRTLGNSLSNGLRVCLKCFEGHYSHYAAGDFYRKHLDQHKGQRHRQITLVCYLNDCEGGELVIYKKSDRKVVDAVVKPTAGKLVVFLSPFIFHEVRPSITDRFGLTGWFRDDEDHFSEFLKL